MILREYLRHLGLTHSRDVNAFHGFFGKRGPGSSAPGAAVSLTYAGLWGPAVFIAAAFFFFGRISFYPSLAAGLSLVAAGMALFFVFLKRFSFIFWQREICGALCFLGQAFIVFAASGQEDGAVFGAFFLSLGVLCLTFPLLLRGGGYPVFSAAFGMGLWALCFRELGDPYFGMPCFITISLPLLLVAVLSPPEGKELHDAVCFCLMLPLLILLLAVKFSVLPEGVEGVWANMTVLPPIFYAVSALFVLQYQEFSFAPFLRAPASVRLSVAAAVFAGAFLFPVWIQGALFGLFLAYLLGSFGLFLAAGSLLLLGLALLLLSDSFGVMMFYGLGACLYLGGTAFLFLYEKSGRRP